MPIKVLVRVVLFYATPLSPSLLEMTKEVTLPALPAAGSNYQVRGGITLRVTDIFFSEDTDKYEVAVTPPPSVSNEAPAVHVGNIPEWVRSLTDAGFEQASKRRYEYLIPSAAAAVTPPHGGKRGMAPFGHQYALGPHATPKVEERTGLNVFDLGGEDS